MSEDKPPKFRADGMVDGRGHGEGSKSTRFAPGDQRRRPGRPKLSPDDRTIMRRVRDMKVTLSDASNRRKKVTTPEALMIILRKKALSGDLKAMSELFKRFDRYDVPSAESDQTRELLAEDQMILNSALNRGLLTDTSDREPGDAT